MNLDMAGYPYLEFYISSRMFYPKYFHKFSISFRVYLLNVLKCSTILTLQY